MRPRRTEPATGQESVWDYPRPPALKTVPDRVRVVLGGVTIAESTTALRVLETSHPPVYYLPPTDIGAGVLTPGTGTSSCEWKGAATYLTVSAGGLVAANAAWRYERPEPRYGAMASFVAFYAQAMDACFVGEERAEPQPGGFYGGWVTSGVVGPFKGEPGTWGW